MYLYSKENDRLKIYHLIKNGGKIYNFKKSEMEKIDKNNMFFRAVQLYGEKILSNKRDVLCIDDLYSFKHELQAYNLSKNEKARQEMILESFYLGNAYEKAYCVQCGKAEGIEALATNGDYKYPNEESYAGTMVMNDVINITIKLYYLSKFEYGFYNEIPDDDLEEILSLYDSCLMLKDYKEQELEHMEKIGLINLNCIEEKINKSKKLMKIIKKSFN